MAVSPVRAMVLDGERSLVLEEFARPAITADGAMLRVEACGYPLERTEEALLDLAGRLGGPPAVHVAIMPWRS